MNTLHTRLVHATKNSFYYNEIKFQIIINNERIKTMSSFLLEKLIK